MEKAGFEETQTTPWRRNAALFIISQAISLFGSGVSIYPLYRWRLFGRLCWKHLPVCGRCPLYFQGWNGN